MCINILVIKDKSFFWHWKIPYFTYGNVGPIRKKRAKERQTNFLTWPFIRSYIKADGITQSWVSHSILKEQIRLSILIGAFCFIKITFYIYKYLCIDLYWSFSLSRKQNFLMIRLVFNCISFFKFILDFIITIFILFVFWNF